MLGHKAGLVVSWSCIHTAAASGRRYLAWASECTECICPVQPHSCLLTLLAAWPRLIMLRLHSVSWANTSASTACSRGRATAWAHTQPVFACKRLQTNYKAAVGGSSCCPSLAVHTAWQVNNHCSPFLCRSSSCASLACSSSPPHTKFSLPAAKHEHAASWTGRPQHVNAQLVVDFFAHPT